ncbi:MAG TPA: hypothetical protein VLC71_00480 [Thermomonas sp.]|nr:hypothetical protein [Thermomonas sp.]
MKMRPQRIALLAIVLLLLVGAAWWWQAGNATPPSPARPAPVSEPEPEPGAGVALTPSPAGSGHVAASMDDAIKRCGMALRDAFNARALQLESMQDGGSQMAYALAVPVGAPVNLEAMTREAQRHALQQRADEVRRAFQKAVAFARDDRDVLWVAAHRCAGGDDCEAARRELRQAEPGNMLVWLREMEEASRNDDPAATRLAFERAASAPEYDAHTGAVQSIMRKAYGALPMPMACADEGVQRAMQGKMGMELGRPFGVFDNAMMMASLNDSVPAFSTLRKLCPPDAGLDPARRAACLRILTRLAEGDIWIQRMIGLDVLVQMLDDAPEAAAWRERYRESRWMTTQLADQKIRSLLLPEDYWNDEARSVQAALQVAGRWPPPADWLPDEERSRSLILTGRAPQEKKPGQ